MAENRNRSTSEPDSFVDKFSRILPTRRSVPFIIVENQNFELEYNMEHASRGLVLVFNNIGNDIIDKSFNRLKTALIHLGFQEGNMRVYENFTRNEIKKTLNKIACEDHRNSDCLLVVILMRNGDDLLYAEKSTEEGDELWNPLVGFKCKSLSGKPKIFLVQECGELEQQQIIPMDTYDYIGKQQRIPAYADFYIAYSSTSDDKPWFIEYLCDVFEEQGQTEDLASMMTSINLRIAVDTEDEGLSENKKKMKIPCLMSMLTKKVYFRQKAKEMQTEKISVKEIENDGGIAEAETCL